MIDIEREKLGYGFLRGVNNIPMTKILEWQHSENINWKAFLWYIADYIKIIDFGDDWFKVYIVSNKQLNFFYNKIIEYRPDMCEGNYFVDITNDLWVDHKRGTERNKKIILRLLEQTETK